VPYEACVAGSGRGSRWITRGRIRHEPHSAIASRSSDNVSVQGITHSSIRITGAKTHRCVALSERSDPASIRHFTPLYGQHSQRDAIIPLCADATSHRMKPRWSAPTNLTAIPCGTCVREHSGEHPAKSRPSRHPGRAGSGHGRPHGGARARPARALRATAGLRRPAPRRDRADSQGSRFSVRQVAARTAL
jgi:hypothetical protein